MAAVTDMFAGRPHADLPRSFPPAHAGDASPSYRELYQMNTTDATDATDAWPGTFLATVSSSFPTAFLQASAVYYAAAVFLHYIVPFFVGKRLASVQTGRREKNQVRREAIASLGPLLVKSAIWSVVDWLVVVRERHGLASSWVTVHDGEVGSVSSLLATVLVLDFLHDAWFYWTHRLLHTKALYRRVHYMHHDSRVPTAFTGYSFHVLEAVIVFFNEILICFFLPIHTRVHRYYHMYTTVIHCGGHAGYEIAPYVPSLQGLCSLLLTQGKVNEVMTTVEHHDLHHQLYTIHFGLYFQVWDRLMGTNGGGATRKPRQRRR